VQKKITVGYNDTGWRIWDYKIKAYLADYAGSGIDGIKHRSGYNSIQFNSIQFWFINVPNQQLDGQLQKQHNKQTQITME
jgi:hypothetical protein